MPDIDCPNCDSVLDSDGLCHNCGYIEEDCSICHGKGVVMDSNDECTECGGSGKVGGMK